ncbi:MAG: hypothetical protein ABSG00_00165 [Terracidiphilus sp.]|jgi:hypothetical protein
MYVELFNPSKSEMSRNSPVPWHEIFPRRQEQLASIISEALYPASEGLMGKIQEKLLRIVCLCSGNLIEHRGNPPIFKSVPEATLCQAVFCENSNSFQDGQTQMVSICSSRSILLDSLLDD